MEGLEIGEYPMARIYCGKRMLAPRGIILDFLRCVRKVCFSHVISPSYGDLQLRTSFQLRLWPCRLIGEETGSPVCPSLEMTCGIWG
jgi:hypothetical protein